MTSGRRLEIRPREVRNVVRVTVGCAAFVVAGTWMLLTEHALVYRLAGGAAVAFFGLGLLLTPVMARRRLTLALTPAGLEQVRREGVATIPWADVAAVGVASPGRGPDMVGILLTSYDRYLERMPPELAAQMTRFASVMRPVAGEHAGVVHGPVRDMVTDLVRARGLAGVLALHREHFGFDVLLSADELDRPAAEFAALLRQYASGQGSSHP